MDFLPAFVYKFARILEGSFMRLVCALLFALGAFCSLVTVCNAQQSRQQLEAQIGALVVACRDHLDMAACDRVLEYPTAPEFRRRFNAVRQDAIRRKARLDHQRILDRIQAPPPPAAVTVAQSPPSYPSNPFGPILVILAVIAAFFWRRIFAGLYQLFVQHPATGVVMPVVGTRNPIDGAALKDALTPLPRHIQSPPSVHHSQHMAERARAMSAKLDADAEIARAAEDRARAQAALKDAEARLAEAERKRKRT